MMDLNPPLIERLLRIIAGLRDMNNCLQMKVTSLESENIELTSEIAALKAQFKEYQLRHPQHVGIKSGKAYEVKPPIPHDMGSTQTDGSLKKARKPGGQPGHKGHARKKPEQVTISEIVDVLACPHCGNPDLSRVQQTRTRTIEDIPIPRPFVTEYTIYGRYCNFCKKVVEEPIVTALPRAKLGLNLMLVVVWLKIGIRLTEAAIPQILEQLCGIRISEGEVSHICTLITKEFGEYYDRLEVEVREATARYIDETSWRQSGDNLWLWAFVTKGVALYKIAKGRDHTVPLDVLGESPKGIDVHDRFRAYDKLETLTGNRPQQLCWFHILGDSKDLAEIYEDEGMNLHTGLKDIFDEANAFEHSGSKEDVERLNEKLGCVLEQEFNNLKCKKFAKSILKHRNKLFLFVTNPDVDGTNNRAERAIRAHVVYRKISGGTRSPEGTKRYAVLGSVIQTLKMNGHNFITHGLEIIQTSHQ